MVDQILVRLPEIIILIYAVSILLYFIDFIDRHQKANRMAFWLLTIVWILQTFFLFLYMWKTGRFPVLTLFEGLYFYSWVLITLSLAIHNIVKVDFTVFFTNVIGFIIMAIHAFAPIQTPNMAEQLISELLFLHIMIAILSYGAFSLSFVFSILYLLHFRLLKQRKWQKRLWRFADLAKMEKIAYILMVIGIPMLFISIILGLQWGFMKLASFPIYDAKIIGSFLLMIVYSYIVFLYRKKQVYGKTIAVWNSAAFLILLINFFLVSQLSTFHIWHQ